MEQMEYDFRISSPFRMALHGRYWPGVKVKVSVRASGTSSQTETASGVSRCTLATLSGWYRLTVAKIRNTNDCSYAPSNPLPLERGTLVFLGDLTSKFPFQGVGVRRINVRPRLCLRDALSCIKVSECLPNSFWSKSLVSFSNFKPITPHTYFSSVPDTPF